VRDGPSAFSRDFRQSRPRSKEIKTEPLASQVKDVRAIIYFSLSLSLSLSLLFPFFVNFKDTQHASLSSSGRFSESPIADSQTRRVNDAARLAFISMRLYPALIIRYKLYQRPSPF